MDRTFANTYAAMLDSLRDIKGNTGQSYYTISKRLVDTAAWGLPHSQNMIYIVCKASDAMSTSALFLWPRRSARHKPIDELLQPMRRGDEADLALSPKCKDPSPLLLE